MATDEIIDTLLANTGKQVRVKFSDEAVQTVVVDAVDDEGFLHSDPDCDDPYAFWTPF